METSIWRQALHYSLEKHDIILSALSEQFYLVLLASMLTICLGVPSAILMHRYPRLRSPIMKITGTLYTIPVLAMFGLLIPLFGIGNLSALIALTIYGILPILHNTYEGITGIDPAIREAARGMGADDWQLLRKIDLPLALPKIIAGIRTSVVMNISVATFAVFIGAGGMGTIILQGMRTFHDGMLVTGTIIVALIALTAERLLTWLERQSVRLIRR